MSEVESRACGRRARSEWGSTRRAPRSRRRLRPPRRGHRWLWSAGRYSCGWRPRQTGRPCRGRATPAATTSLFRRFTRITLVQPTSPEWATLLLDDHPAPLRRIEMAAAWERLHQRR